MYPWAPKVQTRKDRCCDRDARNRADQVEHSAPYEYADWHWAGRGIDTAMARCGEVGNTLIKCGQEVRCPEIIDEWDRRDSASQRPKQDSDR